VKVLRLDSVKLDAVTRTPQGGLKAAAYLTRTGVFNYVNDDGSPRCEFRPADEVFRADSLATLPGVPVTRLHPPEMVRADNFKAYATGHVGDNVVRDGEKIAATLYVQDAELVTAIERGDMREISCGYTCDLDETPGEINGVKYDAVQRNIAYNHVAVVPIGRAGAEVRLRLDAAKNALPPSSGPQEKPMKTERIDGVDYEIGSDAHKAAVSRRDEADKARAKAHDELQAKFDAQATELAQAKKDIAELPAKLAAQMQTRAALEQGAKKVLGGEAKFDGLKDSEVRRQVAQKANPDLKLDGKSEDYITALFDIAVAKSTEKTDADDDDLEPAAQLRVIEAPKFDGEDPVESARKRLDQHTVTAWQQPGQVKA
jgi:hypothetical protein